MGSRGRFPLVGLGQAQGLKEEKKEQPVFWLLSLHSSYVFDLSLFRLVQYGPRANGV
ncbi:MAG: hypothetical protein Q8934_09015 [Bacillota bacterium]|nr:hypothetical protein [Bacillota bacterium]